MLLLEKKGYIEKIPDTKDRRVVHLKLLPAGEQALEQARPSDLLKQAQSILQTNNAPLDSNMFMQALTALQRANQSQTFGLCKSCKHFRIVEEGFKCNLTQEALTAYDSEKICAEHTIANDE